MILRTHKNDNFTVLDNTCLRDEDISWAAKGMLAYILHLPNDWQLYVSDLKNRAKNGRDSTSSILNELIYKGYIVRRRSREKGKFSGYEYHVYENGTPQTEKPYTEKPFTDNPNTENPTLLNTNNNQVLKKTKTKSKYGSNSNVLLNAEEFESLKSKFNNYDKKIDDLSFYLASTGKKYKSHYMTILNWSRKDEANSKQEKDPSKMTPKEYAAYLEGGKK